MQQHMRPLHAAGENVRKHVGIDVFDDNLPANARFGIPHAYPEPPRLGLNRWAPSGTWTLAQHAAVVNVLKDLRRRFNVDSDRMFLLGAGEGGAMALDVGLSHPDLFAGVIPVSAVPNFFSLRYSGSEVGHRGSVSASTRWNMMTVSRSRFRRRCQASSTPDRYSARLTRGSLRSTSHL